ncbi:MAG: hypothetical protein VKJ85_11015 [Prochlorothrix sp.]|nr:hypothetical protein [Prochlorothrix sp.]
MKLTLSIEGQPAAIIGILSRVHEHLHGGQSVKFSATLHPERGLGVEGIVECDASEQELQLWQTSLGLLDQAQRLQVRGQDFDTWILAKLEAMGLDEETRIPLFAQLSAMERALPSHPAPPAPTSDPALL